MIGDREQEGWASCPGHAALSGVGSKAGLDSAIGCVPIEEQVDVIMEGLEWRAKSNQRFLANQYRTRDRCLRRGTLRVSDYARIDTYLHHPSATASSIHPRREKACRLAVLAWRRH